MQSACKILFFCVFASVIVFSGTAAVKFDAQTARSGLWSEPRTWVANRLPFAGQNVQIRAGHVVTYDAPAAQVRVLHVGGKLAFSRRISTELEVGLLKVQPGMDCEEDGFNCHEIAEPNPDFKGLPIDGTLEIGTRESPIPDGVTAKIRLRHFAGMDTNSFPALINCGGRWEAHGAPMSRTWVKLRETIKPGATNVHLAEAVSGWKVGHRIIITASKETYGSGNTFRQSARRPRRVQTEERIIAGLEGLNLFMDKPLDYEHFGAGEFRSEVANLSRNVIIESADRGGIRGHTMYHRDSRGGISYAEFRHLGKEGLLGKYAIHFHLVRDSMRGAGVIGASIWDSHNRWLTIHGTDYLLVRDCVGYQSVGHGFFLEDATEQYNILDRNLAVQAYRGKRLPKQALPFDPNDGAGFWWANGRNTLTRNVACENDEYGFRFEIAKRSNFDPTLNISTPAGDRQPTDVRTLPFFRFSENESHSEGLYSFNFGDDDHPSVRGDKGHPFIASNLKAWETHYALRPNVQFFLLDGFKVRQAAYGVYHPDYDAHVYRNLHFDKIDAEPINRGHDDESVQNGTFTYENVTLENCRVGRDPLIQLACSAREEGLAGHFRNLTLKNSRASQGKVVDLGGGPRIAAPKYQPAYYFHDFVKPGVVTKVVNAKNPSASNDASYRSIEGFTGQDVRATEMKEAEFPTLLNPVDDLPPATLVTSFTRSDGSIQVLGVSHDNAGVAAVNVNEQPAQIIESASGIVYWKITLRDKADKSDKIVAHAVDQRGNMEKMGHTISIAP